MMTEYMMLCQWLRSYHKGRRNITFNAEGCLVFS
jgi:hypothetical protein